VEWISVNDKLPDKEVYVLVYSKEKGYAIMYYTGYFWESWDSDSDSIQILHDITHWMPLPEPPEA